MSTATTCPRCSLSVATDAPAGLCPRCLVRASLEPRLPRPFGKYELLERIGAGGMGVIFAAREEAPSRRVALKMIRGGELATPEERAQFRREVESASRLEHRHIVPIFEVGDVDGRAYYTMRLMTGGTLADHRDRLRANPREAARLVAVIARAVHFGHIRGVLHRDLKPANILLDDEGEPSVADFGIAKSLDEDATQTTGLVGTPAYMPPERLNGVATTRGDVWSLGAILYELLAGRPPFHGPTSASVIEAAKSSEPARLRALAPAIDRDLETICHKCLEKDPDRRYSAEQLAADLERYLRGEPISARPIGRVARAWRWSQHHPAAAALAAMSLLLMLTIGLAALAAGKAQERDRREDVLQTNAYAARAVAGSSLFQLRELGDLIESAGADPVVVQWLSAPRGAGAKSAALDAVLERHRGTRFDSIGVLDDQGRATARWPHATDPDYLGRDFGWREYFQGAAYHGRAGSRGAYFARAHESEVTRDYKFTISAPVFAADGRWTGVLFGTIGTDSVLAGVPLDAARDARHTTALLSLRDNERAWKDRPLSHDYAIVVHERLRRGSAVSVDSATLRGIPPPDPETEPLRLPSSVKTLTDDRYLDPVPGFEGRWLAGFAPVGNTGYVVVVQTRHRSILDPDKRLALRMLAWGVVPFAVGAVAIGGVLLARRRRVSRIR